MKVLAVLWDFDGTLVDTKKAKWAQYAAVAAKYYGRSHAEVYRALGKVWGQGYTEELLHEIFGPASASDSFDTMHQRKLSMEEDFPAPAIPFAVETVTSLQENGIHQAIISNSRHELITHDLLRLGFPIEAFFSIQATEDAQVHKPDPRALEPLLEELSGLGVHNRAGVRYVGDAINDYTFASGAGVAFIGLASADVSPEQFKAAGAKVVIEGLPQLLPVINVTQLS